MSNSLVSKLPNRLFARPALAAIGVAVSMAWPTPPARADLALETETARVLLPGQFELSSALEFQTAPDGQEYAAPLAFEFGVVDRLELLIEPVAFTSIQHKHTPPASGLGDLEATMTYLVLKENDPLPAIAVAGEVKFPTATNRQIGSGKYDYRLYAIASKRLGDFDLHFNLGYNVIGAPRGARTRNPIDAEFGFEWFVHPKFDLFGEVTYVGSSIGANSIASESTSRNRSRGRAAGDGTDTGGAARGVLVTSEVAGQEIVGSLGVRYHLSTNIDVFGSFSYDNNDAKLLRTGITLKF